MLRKLRLLLTQFYSLSSTVCGNSYHQHPTLQQFGTGQWNALLEKSQFWSAHRFSSNTPEIVLFCAKNEISWFWLVTKPLGRSPESWLSSRPDHENRQIQIGGNISAYQFVAVKWPEWGLEEWRRWICCATDSQSASLSECPGKWSVLRVRRRNVS